jgi:hypothetical protein
MPATATEREAPETLAPPRRPQVGDTVLVAVEVTRGGVGVNFDLLPAVVVRPPQAEDPTLSATVFLIGSTLPWPGLAVKPFSAVPEVGHWSWRPVSAG